MSAGWYRDGSGSARVQRSVSAALPQAMDSSVASASASGPWAPALRAPRPAPWAQELYDLRSGVLAAGVGAQQQQLCARFVRAVVTPGAAPQGSPPAPACPVLLLSELFVLEGSV